MTKPKQQVVPAWQDTRGPVQTPIGKVGHLRNLRDICRLQARIVRGTLAGMIDRVTANGIAFQLDVMGRHLHHRETQKQIAVLMSKLHDGETTENQQPGSTVLASVLTQEPEPRLANTNSTTRETAASDAVCKEDDSPSFH